MTGYYDKTNLYRSRMREHLINFEMKYNNLLMEKRHELFTFNKDHNLKLINEDYTIQCATTEHIYKLSENLEMFENFSIKYKNEKPLINISSCNVPLIGKCTTTRLIKKIV